MWMCSEIMGVGGGEGGKLEKEGCKQEIYRGGGGNGGVGQWNINEFMTWYPVYGLWVWRLEGARELFNNKSDTRFRTLNRIHFNPLSGITQHSYVDCWGKQVSWDIFKILTQTIFIWNFPNKFCYWLIFVNIIFNILKSLGNHRPMEPTSSFSGIYCIIFIQTLLLR